MSVKKVALGLSGGVDSSVCAKLLLDAGYDVTAVYLECYNTAGCRTDDDRRDALGIATQLGLPFVSLDMKAAYEAKVSNYVYSQYEAGLTPNPDVVCNREIKFGLFYTWAMEQGFDYVATGHYAKITTESQPDGSNHHLLTIPADTHKDQTYFLCQLREDQLTKTLFPLADLTKQQVRDLATQWQLPTAAKKDSTGVCFVGEVSLRDFLSQKITLTPGNVVDIAGNIVGSHQGAAAYTLGQRHGFTVFNQAPDTPPLYVIKKDISRNQLVIGDQAATARHILVVPSFHFINLELSSWRDPDVLSAVDFFVRIRHTSPLLPARIALTSTTKNYHLVSIFLSGPVYGVGEGQFAVLYAAAGDILFCLGGGAIAN